MECNKGSVEIVRPVMEHKLAKEAAVSAMLLAHFPMSRCQSDSEGHSKGVVDEA